MVKLINNNPLKYREKYLKYTIPFSFTNVFFFIISDPVYMGGHFFALYVVIVIYFYYSLFMVSYTLYNLKFTLLAIFLFWT